MEKKSSKIYLFIVALAFAFFLLPQTVTALDISGVFSAIQPKKITEKILVPTDNFKQKSTNTPHLVIPQSFSQQASVISSIQDGFKKIFFGVVNTGADILEPLYVPEKNTVLVEQKTTPTAEKKISKTVVQKPVQQIPAPESNRSVLSFVAELRDLARRVINLETKEVAPVIQNIYNNSYATGGGYVYSNPSNVNPSIDSSIANALVPLQAQISALGSATTTASFSTSSIRAIFSATGALSYDDVAGVFSVSTGYTIPLTASTTEWSNKVGSQWTTSGSNIYYNTGNVGIGTSTPSEKLEVIGNISANGGVLSSTGKLGTAAQLYLLDDVNGYGGIDIHTFGGGLTDSPHSYINLISSRGNANGPTNIELDDDLGMLNFYGQTDSGLELAAAVGAIARSNFSGSTVPADLYFITNKTEKMRITTEGKVGIGTTTPSSRFTLVQSGTSATDGLHIQDSGGRYGRIYQQGGNGLIFENTDRITFSTDTYFSAAAHMYDLFVGSSISNTGANYNGNVGITDGLYVQDNVGIGTTTPNYMLSVAGDANITGALRFGGNAGTAGMVLQSTGTGAQWVATSSLGISGGGSSQWTTTGSDIYYNTGNVGIGTATPNGKLDVQGGYSYLNGLRISGSDVTNTIYQSSGGIGITTGAGGQGLYVAASGASYATHGFGVGTAAPAYALHVRPLDTDEYGLYIDGLSGQTANLAQFNVAGVQKAFVDKDGGAYFGGNVGIGISNPSQKLDVNGNVLVGSGGGTAYVYLRDAYNYIYNADGLPVDVKGHHGVRMLNDLGEIARFGTAGDTFNSYFNGNVGIGTSSPMAPLSVIGQIPSTGTIAVFGRGGPEKNLYIYAGDYEYSGIASAGDLHFRTNTGISPYHSGVLGMVIKTSGNVGIGTTTPGYALSVAGDANITGALRFAGNAGTAGMVLLSNGSGAPTWVATSSLGISGGGSSQWTTTGSDIYYNTGNVGIGTVSPGFKATIAQDMTMNADVTAAQLSIQGATTPGKRLVLGYDTNSNGFGFIKSGYLANTWTPLVLQPNGGAVSVGSATNVSSVFSVTGTGTSLNPLIEITNTASALVGQINMRAPNLAVDASTFTYLGKAFATNDLAYNAFTYAGSGSANNRYGIGFYGGTDVITALASGNVGIGTTTPAAALHVSGNALFGSTMYVGSITASRLESNTTFGGLRYYNGAETSARFTLSTGAITNGVASLVFDSTALGFAGGGAGIGSPSGRVLAFYTSNGSTVNTERMRISSAGNVGIGTTTPVARLAITSGSSTAVGLVVQGTTSQSANLQEWKDSSGVNVAHLSADGGYFAFGSSGGTSIGTAASAIGRDNSRGGATVIKSPIQSVYFADQSDATFFSVVSGALTVPKLLLTAGATNYTPTIDSYHVVGGSSYRPGISTTAFGNTVFMAPDIYDGSPITVTDAATVYIDKAPFKHPAGATVSGNKWALWVDDGNSRFDGSVGIGTAAPQTTLHVGGDMTTDGITSQLTSPSVLIRSKNLVNAGSAMEDVLTLARSGVQGSLYPSLATFQIGQPSFGNTKVDLLLSNNSAYTSAMSWTNIGGVMSTAFGGDLDVNGDGAISGNTTLDGTLAAGTTTITGSLADSNAGAPALLKLYRPINSGISYPNLFEIGVGKDHVYGVDSNTLVNFMTNSMNSGTADTAVMSLTGSGRVGIGTTTPGSTLDVWGGLRVGTSSTPLLAVDSALGRIGINTATNQAAKLTISTTVGGDDALVLRDTTNGGNARFYFTSPVGSPPDLHISSNRLYLDAITYVDSLTSTDGTLELANNQNLFAQYVSTFKVQTNVANTVIFDSGYNLDTIIRPYLGKNMQLAPDGGNVGIGTTTPNYLLSIAGDTNITGALRFGGNAGTAGMVLLSNGTSTPTWVATSSLGISGGGSSQWTTDGSNIYYATGNVGIGTSTSPSQRLSLYEDSGDIKIGFNDSSSTKFIIGTDSANNKNFNISSGSSFGTGNDVLTILSNTVPTTSYANTGGTGARSGVITVTDSGGLFSAGSGANFIDGSMALVVYFNSSAASGKWIQFDFGSGQLIDEAKWYQSGAFSNGTWKWQGSNDAGSWTDIGSTFTLGGVTTQTHTTLNGNTSGYRYYRLLGMSGNVNTWTGGYQLEIEFKIASYSGGQSYLGVHNPTPSAALDVKGWGAAGGYVLRARNSAGTDLLSVLDSGNVGVGTTTPGHALSIAGDTNMTGALRFGGNAGTAGMVLLSNGSGAPAWVATSSLGISQWTTTGSDIYYNTGNVGIGNSSPTNKLDIIGNARIQSGKLTLGDQVRDDSIDLYGSQYTIGLRGYTLFAKSQQMFRYESGLTNSSYNAFEIGNSGGGTFLVVNNSGNLGVGTSTPGSKLTVAGGKIAVSDSVNAGISLAYTGASGRVYELLSCFNCGSAGLGGLEVHDATASAARAFIQAGVNGWQTPSDLRLKENVVTLSVLDKIALMRGTSYALKDSGISQIGVIAQEIKEAFPEAVSGEETEGRYLGVSYNAIATIALQGVKELNTLVQDIVSRVEHILAWFSPNGDRINIEGMVCVDDICLTKEQFKMLLIRSGDASQYLEPTVPTPPVEDNTSTTTPDTGDVETVPETGEAEVTDPVVEPTPVTPTEEPVQPTEPEAPVVQDTPAPEIVE